MKSGFVYLWRDRKTKMFYLGSHCGPESDRYVCGSRRMRLEYKRRPEDFKRRVILRAEVPDHRALKEIEQKFLDLIDPWDFGTRYYNLNGRAYGADPERASEWMQGNKNGLGKPCSEEKKRKISVAQKGRPQPQWLSEKLGVVRRGRRWYTNGVDETATKNPPDGWVLGRSPVVRSKLKGSYGAEHAAQISAGKRAANAKRKAVLGYVHTPETRAKISATKRARAHMGAP